MRGLKMVHDWETGEGMWTLSADGYIWETEYPEEGSHEPTFVSLELCRTVAKVTELRAALRSAKELGTDTINALQARIEALKGKVRSLREEAETEGERLAGAFHRIARDKANNKGLVARVDELEAGNEELDAERRTLLVGAGQLTLQVKRLRECLESAVIFVDHQAGESVAADRLIRLWNEVLEYEEPSE